MRSGSSISAATTRAHNPENVFDIQTPVAIVMVVRHQGSADGAVVHYRRVGGGRVEKFAEIDRLSLESEWALWRGQLLETPWSRILRAPNGLPCPYSRLFPWQQPGCKFDAPGRSRPALVSLPSAGDRQVEEAERAERFVTPSSGRNK